MTRRLPIDSAEVTEHIEALTSLGDKWYIIQCKDSSSLQNLQALVQASNLQLKDSFIPKEWKTTFHRGMRKNQLKNSMPGYGFIKTTFSETLYFNVWEARGCGWLEEGAHNIRPVSDEEINKMRFRMSDKKREKINNDYKFSPGEYVIITEGPFTGFAGQVATTGTSAKNVNNQHIYYVVISIFGRDTRVEFEESLLKKAE